MSKDLSPLNFTQDFGLNPGSKTRLVKLATIVCAGINERCTCADEMEDNFLIGLSNGNIVRVKRNAEEKNPQSNNVGETIRRYEGISCEDVTSISFCPGNKNVFAVSLYTVKIINKLSFSGSFF